MPANDRPLLDQRLLPQSDWQKTLDLPEVPVDLPVLIELRSDPFVPARLDPMSGDRRPLGVRVKKVILKRSATP